MGQFEKRWLGWLTIYCLLVLAFGLGLIPTSSVIATPGAKWLGSAISLAIRRL
jgi:hypothetical protein